MKKALMQGIENTLVKDFELSFHFVNTGIKSAFISFLETTLLEMIQQGS